MIKKLGKSQSKKSKRSDIKYVLAIDFLTKTTKKCANFVDALLVLHFSIFFARLSYLYIPMTKMYKYERWAKLLL